jgi:hypothetical protein
MKREPPAAPPARRAAGFRSHGGPSPVAEKPARSHGRLFHAAVVRPGEAPVPRPLRPDAPPKDHPRG